MVKVALPSTITPGFVITASALLPENANWVDVRITDGDYVGFVVNPRINQQAVVRNSRSTDGWGSEERWGYEFPVKASSHLTVTITALSDSFQFAFNGQTFGIYRYRYPVEKLTHVEISGDPALSEEAVTFSRSGIFREEFYIVSDLHGKVAEVSADSGLVANPKKPGKDRSQLFYVDDKGLIRSSVNDLPFAAQPPHQAKLLSAPDYAHAQWRWDGLNVKNENGEVLDINGESTADGAHLIAWHNNDKANQHWKKEVA